MPTKNHKPASRSAGGYTAELSFSDVQIVELADLLALPSAVVGPPLAKAAAAIGRFRYTLEATSTLSEQLAALIKAAELGDCLLAIVRDLDPEVRKRVLTEYAGGPLRDPYEGPDEEVAVRSCAALMQFKRDIAGLSRLYENLAVARNRVKPRRGAPKKLLEREASQTLGEAYDCIVGGCATLSRQQFVLAAIKMLGI